MVTRQIKLINLKHQRVISQRACVLTMEEEVLNYVMDFVAEEPVDYEDPLAGWREQYKFYDVTVRREAIKMVDLTLCEGRVWRVSMGCIGVPDELRIYFRHQYQALELLEELKTYIKHGVQHINP